MRIKINYQPRKHFLPFHMRNQRWSILVAHRRAGKTVAAINDLIERATRNTRPAPRYAYVAPLLRQAKDIAWQYLKEAALPFKPKISEAGLYVELEALPNNPRITLYGADNPDSFRGMYFDGVVLDEFGNMVESVWKEVLLPALIDRRGWAVFMGTPNGPNHFRDMYYAKRREKDWLVVFLPVTETGVIPDDDLAEMKKIMDPEQYAQEMLCSFEASVRGAIYARQIEQMMEERRIGNFQFDQYAPVSVVMDLGWKDATSIGFVQPRPDGLLMGHAFSDNLKPISTYIQYIKDFVARRRLRLDTIYLPHDAKAKSLQTGKSIIENFRAAGLRPKLVTELSILDGIAATRKMFPRWYMNERECESLILALKSYHRKYDEDKKIYSNEPVHDWSSHHADMFRYANIVFDVPTDADYVNSRAKPLANAPARPVHYGFALNDIWDTGPSRNTIRL